MRRLVAACLGLAALSLLLPSEPTYDPWAWLVWGRELVQGTLDTSGGPSWKPLPVAFTTVTAPLGALDESLPPAAWLLVARAGGLLAVALAFRVAFRLAGGARTGYAAGGLAALALVLSPQWLRYLAHGNEAPLAAGLMLWAVDRHLEGSRRQALVLGFLACLARPEAVPFLALYGAWTWRAEPERRALLAGLGVALPALWIVPEWLGSGFPLSAGEQARSEPPWSLSRAEQPWLEALERAHRLVGLPVELAAAFALATAGRRGNRPVLVLGAVGLAWLVLVAAMTEAGFSGNARYFLPIVVIACVLAGVGAASLVAGVAAAPLSRPARVALPAGVAVVLALCSWPYLSERGGRLGDQARDAATVAGLHRDLVRAVRRAGGPRRVTARGVPAVNTAFTTRLAWELRLTLADVQSAPGSRDVFLTREKLAGPATAMRTDTAPLRRLRRVGGWEVLRRERGWRRRVERAG